MYKAATLLALRLLPRAQNIVDIERRTAEGEGILRRDEIIRGIMKFAEEYKQGTVTELTEDSFNRYLFSAGVPDPDLLIRPGGEVRLSNFLMWQSAYSELYFTDTLWPDFTKADINAAIAEFQRRDRRYGGVKL